MSGKRAAVICPKCKSKMKRMYGRINSKFQGLANGCARCGNVIWDGEQSAFDKAWQHILRGGQ